MMLDELKVMIADHDAEVVPTLKEMLGERCAFF